MKRGLDSRVWDVGFWMLNFGFSIGPGMWNSPASPKSKIRNPESIRSQFLRMTMMPTITTPMLPIRRGVAMLLVLISLMLATIMTTAYLASRDNSDLVSANTGSGVSARSVALTGMDIAQAIMQTNTNWRTADPNGKLLSGFAVGGGTVDVQATDELTGHAPTATTQYLLLSALGTFKGVQENAQARVYAPLAGDTSVDVDLSEFAAFTANKL